MLLCEVGNDMLALNVEAYRDSTSRGAQTDLDNKERYKSLDVRKRASLALLWVLIVGRCLVVNAACGNVNCASEQKKSPWKIRENECFVLSDQERRPVASP
jgi:hypothetical protein